MARKGQSASGIQVGIGTYYIQLPLSPNNTLGGRIYGKYLTVSKRFSLRKRDISKDKRGEGGRKEDGLSQNPRIPDCLTILRKET